jgi:hypothetical protein
MFVKVYLSSETQEREDNMCLYAFGKIKSERIEKVKRAEGVVRFRHFVLEPLDFEPEDIDYFVDSSYCKFDGEYKQFKRVILPIQKKD